MRACRESVLDQKPYIDAHLVVDYGNMLKLGLKGYEERARKQKAELDLTDPAAI